MMRCASLRYPMRQPPALCAHTRCDARTVPLLDFKVFEPCPASRAQAIARLFDTTQEPWVVFETVLKPVFFRFESDQHARGLAVARDDDLLSLGFSQEARQIIFDLR